MSQFMMPGKGGREGDEQRFLDRHKDVIEGQYDRDQMRHQGLQVFAMVSKLPTVLQVFVYLVAGLSMLVGVPFFCYGMYRTGTHYPSANRLANVCVIGFLTALGLGYIYLLLPRRI